MTMSEREKMQKSSTHSQPLELIFKEQVVIGKVNYDKPVAIIYNPNSGKKRDVSREIT
jgi:hypothetical protein